MSSFIIDRTSYIKLAGFLSALNERHNFYGIESGLYMWKYDEKGNFHLMNDDDYIKELVSIYNANVISVQNQYNDKKTIKDIFDYSNPLIEEEKKAFKIAKERTTNDIHTDRRMIKNTWFNLNKFISSVAYQIEDEELQKYATTKLNEYLRRVSHIAFYSEYEDNATWGEFELGLE